MSVSTHGVTARDRIPDRHRRIVIHTIEIGPFEHMRRSSSRSAGCRAPSRSSYEVSLVSNDPHGLSMMHGRTNEPVGHSAADRFRHAYARSKFTKTDPPCSSAARSKFTKTDPHCSSAGYENHRPACTWIEVIRCEWLHTRSPRAISHINAHVHAES